MTLPITASLIIIGDEILCGQIQDLNVQYIAHKLFIHKGIKVSTVSIIPDDRHIIAQTVQNHCQNYDLVFTTGGIGPTHDDVTIEAIALAFNVPVVQRDDILELFTLTSTYVTQEHRLMARLPQGGEPLMNPVSIAPGFLIENVYVLPGIPKITQAMFDLILQTIPHNPKIYYGELIFQLKENDLAAILQQLHEDLPSLSIGSYPFTKQTIPMTKVSIHGTDREMVLQTLDNLKNFNQNTCIETLYPSMI